MILYIYCAGGFGKELIDVARRINLSSGRWSNIKFIDDLTHDKLVYGAEVLKYPEISVDNRLEQAEFSIANGEPIIRERLLKKLDGSGCLLATIVDTSAVIANSALIESGVSVAPLCSISSDVILERNSCINTMSIVGHDVRVGKNTAVSSMVNLGGSCIVGDNSYIGMGALIKEGVRIGSNAIVGIGSVVYNDIPDGMIALGNPARVVRHNSEQKVFK
jgi:sugar O-acyltransferase (sialic acid O-acetyltransferase NeuD family)